MLSNSIPLLEIDSTAELYLMFASKALVQRGWSVSSFCLFCYISAKLEELLLKVSKDLFNIIIKAIRCLGLT